MTGHGPQVDAGAATSPPVVQLETVRKVYGEGAAQVTALDDVTVDFVAGTFTAVMGPSGSGKTTLLQCAAGLSAPTGGSVVVGGKNLTGMPERELAVLRRLRMGFVFQGFNLLPALTGRENMVLPLRLAGRREDDDWLDSVLDRIGMSDHVDRHPHELSGGQQQRVAIGRALMGRPDVIFADEPTGALDTRTGAVILSLLREAVDELDQTVVMVTHAPAAAGHADRVLSLRDGRIVDRMDEPTTRLITQRLADLD